MAVLVAASGCTSPAPEGNPPATSHQLPAIIKLEGCFGSWSRIPVPDALLPPPPVPTGWEVDTPSFGFYSTFVSTCEHISLGPFERGPVSILLESHEVFMAPPKCREGNYDFLNPLLSILVSDQEIASYMQSVLEIPAALAKIQHEETGIEGNREITWSWTVEGGPRSELQSFRIENPTTNADASYQYAWGTSKGLSMLNIQYAVVETIYEPATAVARFSEPMFLANSGMPILLGQGGNLDAMPASGTFTYFGDTRCEQPL